MKVLSVAPFLVAALGAKVTLSAPAAVADTPEVNQGPSLKHSVSLLTPTTTSNIPAETCTEAADGQVQCNPVKRAEGANELNIQSSIPASKFTAETGIIPFHPGASPLSNTPTETCTEAADGQVQCTPVKRGVEFTTHMPIPVAAMSAESANFATHLSVKRDVEFTTHMPIPVAAMSAESVKYATHLPVPTSAVTAENDTIALKSSYGIEARAKDTVCDAFLDCALSPPEHTTKTAMVTKPTPLPTEPPAVPTVSSSVVPALSVGTPLTDLITADSPDAYCWNTDNGQVHCVWTYTHARLAKRTAAPEPTTGSLTEREVLSVPTTLVTVVKREGEVAEEFTRAT